MTALIVLRNEAIRPLLAAAQPLGPPPDAQNPKPIDLHYQTINVTMQRFLQNLRTFVDLAVSEMAACTEGYTRSPDVVC